MSDSFTTAVEGVAGSWPALPDRWSFSSLKEAEECPRRWMLSHAAYPRIWDRNGYPDQAVIPALLGDVVHRVLERILRGLRDENCEGVRHPCAVQVLKALGGYSRLIELTIDEQLQRYEKNPRVADRLSILSSALRSRVPEIRQRVQTVISRTNLIPPSAHHGTGLAVSRTLGMGSHPEVELLAPTLNWMGRADLLTVTQDGCEITDYKTGVPHQQHAEQLQVYALLWARDEALNPNSSPVRRLTLTYPTHDEAIDVPNAAALDALEVELSARLRSAQEHLRCRPPEARPDADMCSVCSVRHLCDEYWTFLSRSDAPGLAGPQERNFLDAQVRVIGRNGPRSWNVTIRHPGALTRPAALLRTPAESISFQSGDRLRLLRVTGAQDEDSDCMVLTILQSSEIFPLSNQ